MKAPPQKPVIKHPNVKVLLEFFVAFNCPFPIISLVITVSQTSAAQAPPNPRRPWGQALPPGSPAVGSASRSLEKKLKKDLVELGFCLGFSSGLRLGTPGCLKEELSLKLTVDLEGDGMPVTEADSPHLEGSDYARLCIRVAWCLELLLLDVTLWVYGLQCISL